MARKTKEDALATRAQIIDAARRVFHSEGVNRSTLDKVAKEAGVTRGAVYWHFANKAELFVAVKETYICGFDKLQTLLTPQANISPLMALKHYLDQLFTYLLTHTETRETFEIIMLRCEYVEEFNEALQLVTEPCTDLLMLLRKLYEAAEHELKPGLNPEIMALDTLAFLRGTIRAIISEQQQDIYRQNIQALVETHISLRRRIT